MHEPDDHLRARLFHFRRRFNPAQRRLRGLLIVSPWLDVLLLLLLFMVTQSSFVVQPGVVLELPLSESNGYARYGDLVVTIPQEGMFFFRDERMTLEGLGRALLQEARQDADRALIIEADQRITHHTLVEVYNMAVSAGLHQVLLATRSPASP